MGSSAYAGPRYQKLYGRVIRVWNNRRGQPKRSAMQEPRPGRSPLVIRFASPSGKYEFSAKARRLVRIENTLHVVAMHFFREQLTSVQTFLDCYLAQNRHNRALKDFIFDESEPRSAVVQRRGNSWLGWGKPLSLDRVPQIRLIYEVCYAHHTRY